ncbi:hypothetical protein [Streptomyces sp. RerS4]|uniref:hypothetical protein n=1 Tax=Streptomyces sp. RerS4 TaxID=2942449 RepID=UPI00201C98F6|nr:hypothetical protein [Streptomyces sp. RerS4]UQX04741.1 hypothetical protein M4D82_32705 [Streptomyces sp. RerS4]
MEMGDAAGWVGGAAGIAALVYAQLAHRQASRANELAQAANVQSSASTRLAEQANQLAEEANVYARRGEARDIERDDVRWEGDWVEPGRYGLVQQGEATAHDVVAIVSVDGSEVSVRSLRVARGETLIFEFPAAAAAYSAERASWDEAVAEAARPRGTSWPPLPAFVAQPDPLRMGFYNHSISERVDWATAQGAHKVHESEQKFASLGPH